MAKKLSEMTDRELEEWQAKINAIQNQRQSQKEKNPQNSLPSKNPPPEEMLPIAEQPILTILPQVPEKQIPETQNKVQIEQPPTKPRRTIRLVRTR